MKYLRMAGFVCSLAAAAVFALAQPAYSATDDGKATYDQSCVHCHGAEGSGNPVMDQFWKMKIPRLNSEYVQSKSDEEMKNVILNGKRKMPAAMTGNPEATHRTKVTAEQVPGLITYIRTLKSK